LTDAGAAGAAGNAGSAGDAGGGAAPWFSTLPDDVKGYVVNRGLDKVTPVEAFQNAYTAHRNAEKAIGAPSDRVIVKPADAADTAGWEAFYTKLGRPAKAEEYTFTVNDNDKALAEFLKPELHRLGVPKTAAEDLWGKLTAYDAKAKQDELTAEASKVANEDTALRKNWGANYPVNKVIAQRAAAALGIPEDQFNATASKAGFSQAWEMFLKIGQKIGEDKFVSGSSLPVGNAFTREQAISRIQELKADRAWVKRYSDAGRGSKEWNEMDSLLKIVAGEDGRGTLAA
jgi:hypothetical protein